MILIGYSGKSGTTAKCAALLKEKLKRDADVIDLSVETPDISKYDTVVLGGSVRMGKLSTPVKRFISKNRDGLKIKKIAFFICCGFSEGFDKYLSENIPSNLLSLSLCNITLGGEIKVERLKGFERFITKTVMKSEENKKRPNLEILYDNIEVLADRINNY